MNPPSENDYVHGHKPEIQHEAYSVANAKATLPRLIDRAMAGEEVIITRHGRPVSEIRPATARPRPVDKAAFYHWLASRRSTPKGRPVTSVELLNLINGEPSP